MEVIKFKALNCVLVYTVGPIWNDYENVFADHLYSWEQCWCSERVCVKDQFKEVCCNSA